MRKRRLIAAVLVVPFALVFTASAIAHVSTFFGINPEERWPGVMFLHVVVLAGFFIGMLMLKNPTNRHIDAGEWTALPFWMKIVGGALFAHEFFNVITVMSSNGGGVPTDLGGRYELQSHGHVIRTLSASEFSHLKALEVRGFSGHWLVFSWASLCMPVMVARARNGQPQQPPALADVAAPESPTRT